MDLIAFGAVNLHLLSLPRHAHSAFPARILMVRMVFRLRSARNEGSLTVGPVILWDMDTATKPGSRQLTCAGLSCVTPRDQEVRALSVK